MFTNVEGTSTYRPIQISVMSGRGRTLPLYSGVEPWQPAWVESDVTLFTCADINFRIEATSLVFFTLCKGSYMALFIICN